MDSELRIWGVPGLPEIQPGDDLAKIIHTAMEGSRKSPSPGDVFVFAQKIVSKAEGRLLDLARIAPSEFALQWAARYEKDPRVIEVILRESRRIVRMDRGVLIVETSQGYVCANAGVDASNVPAGFVSLLPVDPDASARRLREDLERWWVGPLGVIVSDSFGRPWREGVVDLALGVAGVSPLVDYRGQPDTFGRQLEVTVMAVADELASAAELVMGKTNGVPVALIRGFESSGAPGTGRELVRGAETDLFR